MNNYYNYFIDTTEPKDITFSQPQAINFKEISKQMLNDCAYTINVISMGAPGTYIKFSDILFNGKKL